MDNPTNLPPVVLIVEADPLTQELYRRELSREVSVLTCSDASTALEILHTKKLNAVILEPVSLGTSGWDLLVKIKADPNTRMIPVILCSTQDERRKGLEMGAVSCLVKPVLPSTLLEVLHQVIQHAGAGV